MAEEDILMEEDYVGDIETNVVEDTYTSLQELLRDYDTLKKSYKTSPHLSKYEKTRVLAERAQQITNGSPVFIDVSEGQYVDTYTIAMKELENKKIPFIIKRPYGNTFEYWKVKDLF